MYLQKCYKTHFSQITFILTAYLNSDALENLFSQLRYMGGIGSNCKLGGLAFKTCLRNFILGAGDHIPVEKAASVADCGAKFLIKNATKGILDPRKSDEKLLENDSDSISVIGDLDSILTSMIEDSQTTTNITLDLPNLEDELEDETEIKTDKTKKQRNFFYCIHLIALYLCTLFQLSSI